MEYNVPRNFISPHVLNIIAWFIDAYPDGVDQLAEEHKVEQNYG